MKTSLTLVSVTRDTDKTLADLATMFERITGRRPTPAELASARERLSAAKREGNYHV